MVFILLPLLVVLEVAKRIVSPFLYPLAYIFRAWARTHKDGAGWPLWIILDDSIVADSVARGFGPLEYCGYGKRAPLGFITERLPSGWFTEFLRAWNWGAIRNNCINLTWAARAGNKVGVLWGIHWGRLVYEERLFWRMGSDAGILLPYFEAFIPFTNFRIQIGWISNGRWQVQARSYP